MIQTVVPEGSGANRKKSIVLCCQQPFIARGLAEALGEKSHIELIVCDTVPEVLACLTTVQPAAVIVYLDSGVALSALHDLFAGNQAPVILWGGEFSHEFVYQALQCGLRGALPANMPVDALLAAVEEVVSGGLCFAKGLMEDMLCHKQVVLTRREQQVTSLVAQGLKNKEIAYSLTLTEGTVKVYLSRLFRKLELNDRLELALFGLRNAFSDGKGLDMRHARPDRGAEYHPEPLLAPHSVLLPNREKPKANEVREVGGLRARQLSMLH